jgi:peptidyl-Lys metalloendopeptidase
MWLALAMIGVMASEAPGPARADGVSVALTEVPRGLDGGPSLRFEVVNAGPKTLRFCYWQTPLEGLSADILDVVGPDGQPRPYLGPMVKRRAPRDDDHAVVPPRATLSATFSLEEAYDLTVKGRYLVRFRGNPHLNGLPDSAPVTFEVR